MAAIESIGSRGLAEGGEGKMNLMHDEDGSPDEQRLYYIVLYYNEFVVHCRVHATEFSGLFSS
jgi:hypothetical protein